MVPKKKQSKTYSADRMMLNTASTLIRDFQSNFNDPCFCSDLHQLIRGADIARIREAVPAIDMDSDTASFKATYQIQSIFKRYRFHNDIYSDDELREEAVKSFLNTQSRLADQDLDRLDALSNRILDLAARYVAKVLGPYDGEVHRSLCRFGRKASVGIPSRLACEAARWELPLTGSRAQIDWFDKEMSQDDAVQAYWIRQLDSDPSRSVYQETSALKLTLVPKTFKAFRSIMPNTTIGSYMSFGIGEMIRIALKREGYDIGALQHKHRSLASRASQNNLHVTADLSSASDSITVALVRRLFPADWFDILEQSRVSGVELPDGSVVQSNTFCTMGIGYTFPLQTLVFLSLLFSIQATLYDRKDWMHISVYGDDLFYGSVIHADVVHYFEKFGFVINKDKTFHDGPFRESCGGDYHHGVDVRPFQPRNGSATIRSKPYEAILYKFVNGLLARWSEYEIGHTLNYLISEIESVTGCVKLVPGDFPDDAGVKCPGLTHWDFLKRAKCAKPKHVGHGVFRFSFLRLRPDERKENRHDPYYWAALRGSTMPVFDYTGNMDLSDILDLARRTAWDVALGVKEDCRPLITRDDEPIVTFRSKISGRRLRRTHTCTVVNGTGRYTRQTGLSCFESRR